MKVEYINAFIKATSQVFKTIANIDLSVGKPYVMPSPFEATNLVIIVGITGEIQGQAVIGMTEETAKSLASAMMMGMPVEKLDDMSKSALQELSNMIMGNSATLLFNEGVVVDITPPTLMTGQHIEVSTGSMKTITVPLNCPVGEVLLNISTKE
ncbi:MAG: chemotaxis protein CheX [Clostridia bacterium]|nr:chemotaxis protein CheX [Clostridia bacterium]